SREVSRSRRTMRGLGASPCFSAGAPADTGVIAARTALAAAVLVTNSRRLMSEVMAAFFSVRDHAAWSRCRLADLDRAVGLHLPDAHFLAGRIELYLDIDHCPVAQAVMAFRLGVSVIAGSGLAVVDGDLLVPEELSRAGVAEADLGAGRPPVAGQSD